MNQFLDFTGALLYLVFSIVLIPVFAALQLVLWSASVASYGKLVYRHIKSRQGNRKAYPLRSVIDLALER
jgi:hypothetical protein